MGYCVMNGGNTLWVIVWGVVVICLVNNQMQKPTLIFISMIPSVRCCSRVMYRLLATAVQ